MFSYFEGQRSSDNPTAWNILHANYTFKVAIGLAGSRLGLGLELGLG